MREILEIVAAVLAALGIYTVFGMLRIRLLFPRRVRRTLRAAVVVSDTSQLYEAAAYAAYLRREQKISPERLIILTNDDIIISNEELTRLGELYRYIKCKEINDDTEYTDRREESRDSAGDG